MSSQILGVFNTLSFVLGLLVIPAWILTVVADERHIKRRAASLLPVAMRKDAGAIVAIMDRAFGTFLRHRVLLAIVSGVLVWGGLEVTNAIGLTEVRYTATAGTLLGFLQLIPELGFFLGIFPILLFIPLSGPVAALTAFVVYWAAVKLADGLVGGRVSKGVLDVHPAVLLPAIVVLSQFGVGLAGRGGSGDRDRPRPRALRLRAAVRPGDASRCRPGRQERRRPRRPSLADPDGVPRHGGATRPLRRRQPCGPAPDPRGIDHRAAVPVIRHR